MKKIFIGFPILALLVVTLMSAFTQTETTTSDLVWFKYNPSTGQLVDETDGRQGEVPPVGMNCSGGNTICALAFSISQEEVELVGNEYHLSSGVSILVDFDDIKYQQ